MCLIALAWGASERFPFVIAANRDEFLVRPTAPLSLWTTAGGIQVLGGKDLQDGGTWMAFAANGRFAMLTNVRDPTAIAPARPVSRGGLALAWLESTLPADAWACAVDGSRYQGFNLIVGDWQSKQCHYMTNAQNFNENRHPAGIQASLDNMKLEAKSVYWGGIYGLSNATLDTPWPKTQRIKQALSSGLNGTTTSALGEVCMQALVERSRPEDRHLPDTGVPIDLERALSSAFVSHPDVAQPSYGTRTSLVAIYEAGSGLQVTEVTHAQAQTPKMTTKIALAWD